MPKADTPARADLPYRPCAGIMLVNDAGQVFVARRIDTPGDHWQMPQGGIDKGEDPRAAARRELLEEIGTDRAEIIAETADWLLYDLPDHLVGKVWKGRYRGQTQKWFLMRFTGSDADIDINTGHPEFDAWKWIDLDQVVEAIVPFKRDVYAKVVAEFAPLLRAEGVR
ncbi:RNA pyrophosphohydrolase [Novispirillum sp. DQ9]|uniref:RNA pyrophosphohydrolase n=1 Tax=Novispirillum sp. DQ9 TaxID=3398612 RepID=UPI003C79BC91